MNKESGRRIAAPAQPALRAVEDSRPHDAHALAAILATLALLLGALFSAAPGSSLARALAAQAIALLRAWVRPRARATTPWQHAQALRDLRRLHARHILPQRTPRIRPSRAARRRIAQCWRMLINPPRRRASFARPISTRAPARHTPTLALRTHPPPRAGPVSEKRHPAASRFHARLTQRYNIIISPPGTRPPTPHLPC